MRKDDPADDLQWFIEQFGGNDPVKEPLDEEQRLVSSALSTILNLLEDKATRVEAEIERLSENRGEIQQGFSDHARDLEWNRIDLRNAYDLVFSLATNRKHPIHRFLAAAHRHVGKGHRRPSLRESTLRCILVAFVRVAVKRLRITENAAAARASIAIEGLGSATRTANAIKGYEANASLGVFGQETVERFSEEFKNTPEDQLDRQLRVIFARNLDHYALYLLEKDNY